MSVEKALATGVSRSARSCASLARAGSLSRRAQSIEAAVS